VINLDDAAWDLYQKVEMEIDDEKEKLPTAQMDGHGFHYNSVKTISKILK
jgi:hypothetical protein